MSIPAVGYVLDPDYILDTHKKINISCIFNYFGFPIDIILSVMSRSL